MSGAGSEFSISQRLTLITGGAGFIGRHLYESLLDQLLCLDNFIAGAFENLSHMLNHPRFHLLEHDITEPLELKVDQIHNLVCPASSLQYRPDPVHAAKTKVLGALNMLGLARRLENPIPQASVSMIAIEAEAPRLLGHNLIEVDFPEYIRGD